MRHLFFYKYGNSPTKSLSLRNRGIISMKQVLLTHFKRKRKEIPNSGGGMWGDVVHLFHIVG